MPATYKDDQNGNTAAVVGGGEGSCCDTHKILLLSHKDSDLLALDSAKLMLPLDFPPIESVDLCALKTDSDMMDALNRSGVAVVAASVLGPARTTMCLGRSRSEKLNGQEQRCWFTALLLFTRLIQ